MPRLEFRQDSPKRFIAVVLREDHDLTTYRYEVHEVPGDRWCVDLGWADRNGAVGAYRLARDLSCLAAGEAEALQHARAVLGRHDA